MRRIVNLAAVAVVVAASAARVRADDVGAPRFLLQFGGSIGGAEPAPAAPAFLSGARIAAVADGAVAIDADSGTLVRIAHDGTPTAQLAIGADAGMLAYDPWSGVA